MVEGGSEDKASGSTAPVFISYASQDAAVANAIVESLEQQALKCWLAPRDVRAGAQYADAIVRAISGAKAVVLVLSESAIRSDHSHYEWLSMRGSRPKFRRESRTDTVTHTRQECREAT